MQTEIVWHSCNIPGGIGPSIGGLIIMKIARAVLASFTLVPAVALFAAQPVMAQPRGGGSVMSPSSDSSRVITRINQAELVELVNNSGHTIISQQQQGDVSLVAENENGLFYNLIGQVCDLPDYGPGCLGLEYQVRYDADSRVTWENINAVNDSYRMTKVIYGQNEDGVDTVFITYYAIVDEGQTMANLETVLVNILEIAPQAVNIIFPTE